MTLPASVPISFSQIQAEFSGPNNFRAYLGGGGYVQAGIGVPASGALHFSDFFGKSHLIPPTIFVSSGTYTVPAGVTSVRIISVGGGGGGGIRWGVLEGGGGGGAGGLLDISDFTVSPAQVLTVTIGGGGSAGVGGFGWGLCGYNGGNSSIGTNIICIGGGGGGGANDPLGGDGQNGKNGGSGGGRVPFFGGYSIGLGATGQGNNGGYGTENQFGGGGGGAGGTGLAEVGGAGMLKNINGTNYPLAAGGGGGVGSNQTIAVGGAGGLAPGNATPIGGHGANYASIGATSGYSNTGSGGGGGPGAAGNGGSGIVFIIPNSTAGSGALYPSYSITGPTSINEDQVTATYVIHTTNVSNGTILYYSIFGDGINVNDFTSGLLTGTAIVISGSANINLAATLDAVTEGNEQFYFWIRTGSSNGPVVYASPLFTINDTSITDPNAGGGSTCFPAGSQIMMANGTYINIENVVIGDMVMSVGGPVAITALDFPVLGNRKLLSFADGHRWSEEHGHWTKSSSNQQWWWAYNADTWRAEVVSGHIGGLLDNNSMRTGNGYEFAHTSGWKNNTITEIPASPRMPLYLPRTNGAPIIVDGYLVGAGINEQGFDYTSINWDSEITKFQGGI